MASVRTMVSIPEDLKRQMAKLKGNVNWSAIACQAFAAKLAEVKTPEWQTPCLQRCADSSAGDGVSVAQWTAERNEELGSLMSNCKEYRHSDPGFNSWYTEIRTAASNVSQALDELRTVCNRYSGH